MLEPMRAIWVQPIQCVSKREEMLGNFKLSVRGSIRKAPNVMNLGLQCSVVTQSQFHVKKDSIHSINLLRTWVTRIANLKLHEPALDVAELATRCVVQIFHMLHMIILLVLDCFVFFWLIPLSSDPGQQPPQLQAGPAGRRKGPIRQAHHGAV